MYRVPDRGAEVCLTLMADATPQEVYATPKPTKPRLEDPGWYRGVLHCHNHHSDARGAPESLAEGARLAGLDFLAVTYHNTTSQWQYFGPRSSESLIFIPGMDVTTCRGHANVFDLDESIDFRLGGITDSALGLRDQFAGTELRCNCNTLPDASSHFVGDATSVR